MKERGVVVSCDTKAHLSSKGWGVRCEVVVEESASVLGKPSVVHAGGMKIRMSACPSCRDRGAVYPRRNRKPVTEDEKVIRREACVIERGNFGRCGFRRDILPEAMAGVQRV